MFALNPQQEKSVRHFQGNSLIIAGAGSGKTRTLIAKIVYLIQNQRVAPHHILAITFTNKAAKEMRERVEMLPQLGKAGSGGYNGQGLQIRTFHSFGALFLRRFLPGYGKGYDKNFTIIEPDDQKKILRHLYPDYTLSEFPFKRYLYLISAWKNDFLYPDDDDFQDRAREYYEEYGLPEDPRDLYRNYMQYLGGQNLLDFDDLIGFTIKILRHYPEASDYAADRWKYVLVDEYQDTNFAQEKIIEFFIQKGSAVTVVGDDQQSIYGFRGARMENILSFQKKYPSVEMFILEENYRSTQPILSLANHIISKNPEVFPKKLFTQNPSGETPIYHRFPNDLEEAKWIAEKILQIRDEVPLSEIAIFYRTNYQSRIIEDILIRSRLPYQIVKGQKFYERKEIKDILSYLQWLINPRDRISFERLVNTPPRRLGEKTLEKIFQYLEEHSFALAEIFDHPEISGLISSSARSGFDELGGLFRELREKLESTPPSRLVNHLIQRSGLQDFYESEKDEMIRDQRLGNIDAFFDAIDTFTKETGGGLEDFITSLSLGEEEEKTDEGRVKLMTVHNAKGLEFQAVFTVGMEDGVFPHSLTLDKENEVEEERRLFYVAVTRARKWLYLSSAALKYRYNSMTDFRESRFIEEIEEKYLIKETVSPHYLTSNRENSYRFDNEDGDDFSSEHEYY